MKAAARAMWQQATQMVIDAAGDERIYTIWIEDLASYDVRVQVPAIWALQQAGTGVIPVLIAGLRNQQARIRRNCVDVIDHGGYGGDGRCVAALLSLLHDPVPHIRRAVWHTLFCERCVAPAHCEVVAPALDEYTLLSTIGIHDSNPKLQAQLMQRWRVLHAQRSCALNASHDDTNILPGVVSLDSVPVVLGGWQSKGKCSPLPDCADDPNATTMPLDQMACNC